MEESEIIREHLSGLSQKEIAFKLHHGTHKISRTIREYQRTGIVNDKMNNIIQEIRDSL